MKVLFTPIEVGRMKLKNRIVMTAMDLSYTPIGEVTGRLIAFYEERAMGGVSLIVVGGCTIDEYSGPKTMIKICDDKYIPGLEKLTSAIHRHGSCVVCQLFHAGRYAHSSLIGRQAIAPSAVTSKFTREEPREMTKDEVKYTIENFAKAALRAKKAGFDGVEILGNAGYLISEFLSSITNKRTDKYGGSFENRIRFGLDVVGAVRGHVGKDFNVLVRLAGNDFMIGGNTHRETRIFAKELEKHGVDGFNITGGWHETIVPQVPMEVPRGGFVYLAQGVKAVVSKPVIACNRINNLLLADHLVRQERADLIGFARGLLADPEMPKKANNGRMEEITPCIACNQGCLDNSLRHKEVECIVNPRTGHEFEIPLIFKTNKEKKVMVIGGGPGGLFAAQTAAIVGHRVTLYEQSDRMGGQLNLAAAADERSEYPPLIEVLTRQAELVGVEIHKKTKVDEQLIKREGPDTVILASGGEPIRPNIIGMDGKNVVLAWDVLGDKVDVGKEVVVVGGGATGVEVATYIAKIGTINADTLHFLFLNKAEEIDFLRELATRGSKKVTLIEMLDRIGIDIGLSTRWLKLQNLSNLGVNILTKTTVKEITPEGVIVNHNGKTDMIRCDTVVIAVGTHPVNDLEEKIKDVVEKVIIIGDAKKPRKAYEAIKEGFFAGRES